MVGPGSLFIIHSYLVCSIEFIFLYVIQELVHKGIPLYFRGFVWPLLCGANDSCVKEKYLEYLRMSSPYEKLIRRDVCRTYPEHEQFKVLNGPGQESLFNIIKVGDFI